LGTYRWFYRGATHAGLFARVRDPQHLDLRSLSHRPPLPQCRKLCSEHSNRRTGALLVLNVVVAALTPCLRNGTPT